MSNPICLVEVMFDRTSPNWVEGTEYNLLYLRAQERYANELLARRGHLFLNEVYDMLGFKRTPAGALSGWLGEDVVSFGIALDRPLTPAFKLVLNPRSLIYDKI